MKKTYVEPIAEIISVHLEEVMDVGDISTKPGVDNNPFKSSKT